MQGRGILVTRPALQADALCAAIEAAGGRALRFPLLEINPARNIEQVQTCLAKLCDYSLAIFISANAVHHAMQLMAPQTWPRTVKMAAIGTATAQALTAYGLQADILPTQDFTSEALLALPVLQDVKQQRIVILRGDGGRETLRDILIERGARVDYLEVYRRDSSKADPAELLQHWRKGEIDVVLISSYESLQKLVAIIGTLGLTLLNQTTIIFGNQRTRTAASDMGIKSPMLVAESATDAAMMKALHMHFTSQQTE